MKQFYRTLETIACDPANYPAPYLRKDGIDWKGVAWGGLGTADRMEKLGGFSSAAEGLVRTDLEKQHLAAWRKAIWEWMQEGRKEYLASQK